ncbi:PREDICTED: uncharacterized protein LOC108362036 [Rhagoletis zephyria]|uniref:uncharacterized protein LOC108362036 n=1 Tax=Rhagoletis zephyria TaxID=28612 RepID=UPI0008114925|nr:PREDICTED: uncharacterized protein LOC108362036 [Rhagoletis zephyria]
MLNRPIDSITFWTDSEIVLHWIKTHPSTLQTFVANRVSEIQELTQSASWRHVPTKQNPADQVSRGCSVDEIQNSIWFSGPQFLLEDPASWPINTHFELTPEEQALEKKKNASALIAVSDNRNPLLTVIEKYSSHKKLLRVFAYILRWVLKVRDRSTKYDPTPSAQELQLSFLKIVQIVQFDEYSQEITKLSKNLPLPSSLQKLNPFLHEYSEKSLSLKLLRVGGRLLNAPIPYDAKFPLLLSKNSQFVNSYIRFLHLRNHHAGAKALVAILREKIWFVGRRGIPVTIHCDNATNFVGADRKLKELKEAFLSQKEEVTQYAADEGFKFTFIPPRAPHFGGLWEAAVKSAKHLLVRAVGNASLTAEEIETLLVEVEAVLNSRPIAPLSQDPNDGEALTPAHLLIGCRLRAMPEETALPEPSTRYSDRWQHVCSIKRRFWQTWSRSYLLSLQERNKWQHPQPNVEVGELVVVHEDNAPPQQWILGRVTGTIAGQDGKVRVADVQTRTGTIRLPIHKLAVLPLNDS